jgi:hypothetical protein
MKKIILSIAITLALSGSAFANHMESATDRAVASFHKDFKKASEFSCSEKNNYVLVTFNLDKQIQYAYYDFQGSLIGVVQNILSSSLPEYLRKDIKKHYADYWVSDLFQVTYDDGVYYYVRLKNADRTIVLSTEGTNIWHRYSLPNNKIENL